MTLRHRKCILFVFSPVLTLGFIALPVALAQSSHMHIRQDVDSGWHMRAVTDTDHAGVAQWHTATVPGEVQTDLLAAKLIPDPFYADNEKRLQWISNEDWEYHTTLHPSAAILARQHIELVFDGLDTFADVMLNGHPLLHTNNMFRSWSADVRPYLHAGANDLQVVFHSPYKVMTPIVAKLPYILPGSGYEAYDPAKDVYPIGQYIRTAGYMYGWDWGPKLVTMGIWRPVHLEAWDDARITDLHIEQRSVTAERALLAAEIDVEASHAGNTMLDLDIASISDPQSSRLDYHAKQQLDAGINHLLIPLRLEHPKRWYPVGYGPQERYHVTAALVSTTAHPMQLDTAQENIGLRSVELRRKPDQWGVSFTFVVNGIPIFAKGANVIPMDSFPARVTPARERALLTAARDANMNMIRMWGGGYYQTDSFYETADELGLMVWQEFAFGGGLVPGDKAFEDNVRQEAIEQVKRLRDHPSIVLWCGNNEVETSWDSWGDRIAFKKSITPDQRERVWQDYVVMFRDILKSVVALDGGGTPYWPSSPGADFEDIANNDHNGDMHYWNIWSGQALPIEDYRRQQTRFMSEYGFQGMPDMATVRAFAGNEEDLASPALANHERYLHGFDRMKHYLDEETGPAPNFAAFDYLSQFVQAEAIRIAAEHLRSEMPRTMGSLYWQLNDCWPVASWSSIDYFGRPKALQYYAKRFYAPVLIAPVYTTNAQNEGTIEAHIISDLKQPIQGKLQIRVMDFNGNILHQSVQSVTIPARTSEAIPAITTRTIHHFDPEHDFAAFELVSDGKVRAQHTLYFARPKNLQLPQASIDTALTATPGSNIYQLKLTSDTLARAVQISTPGLDTTFSNNFFDLLPGETVTVQLTSNASLQQLKAVLQVASLVDFLAKPERTN